MRILHTADWHLGRTFAGFDLLEDQVHALEGLAAIAERERPHAVVVAGDVYDRSVPPEEAVRACDEILVRLAAVAPVLVIAGNHDSGERIDFGRRLLRQAGVHVAGTARPTLERVDLRDDHGVVAFHLMPYATPEEARFALGRDDLRTHDDATRARIAAADLSGATRHVLVGHLFAQGGRATRDSERDLAVGGLAEVDPAAFAPFTYTALGHLHRPHAVGGRARYAGSLARYSFAEEDHEKTASLVEIDAAGDVSLTEIPLPQRRGMRTLQGGFDDLLRRAAADGGRETDLVRVVVTDPILPPGARDQFSRLYRLLLAFEHQPPRVGPAPTGGPGDAAARRSEREFLDAFFAARYTDTVLAAERALAGECMDEAVRGAEDGP
ncbi:MAG: exonuclease SbcCD subunit D [Planctomycetaceae bacterium]